MNQMLSGWRNAAALSLAAGVLFPTCVAATEESGSFSMIRVQVQDYTTFEHAGGSVFGGALEGTSTILESSGGPFVEGEHSVSTCVAYGKRGATSMDLEIPCATTDASGDRLDSLSKRVAGGVEAGGGGEGRMELLGGTGKYAGITGSCGYEVGYLAGKRLVLMADCTWRRSQKARRPEPSEKLKPVPVLFRLLAGGLAAAGL